MLFDTFHPSDSSSCLPTQPTILFDLIQSQELARWTQPFCTCSSCNGGGPSLTELAVAIV
jgi:hypothetical protein